MIFRVIALLLISATAFAQDPYEEFIQKFTDNYNSEAFDANYDLTADGFKAQVTKEYFTQILSGAFTSAGKITGVKLAESGGQGKVYLLTCERAAFALSVALDASGKAAGLLIKPIEKPAGGGPQSMIDKWKSTSTNAGLVIGRINNGVPDIQYLGVANKETPAPLTSTSIFEIGSISKPLTGILLHTLIADGKITLDDPVNKFLPKDKQLPRVKDKEVLIRHLVTHGSCLPRMPDNFHPAANEQDNPYKHYTEKDLLAFLPTVKTGDCELNATPTYSNLGAGLLGYILTKVSGKTYKELFETRMAHPLHTKSFGVVGASDQWTHGHVPSGALQVQWDFTDVLVGAGGVDASADDLVKVLTFFMTPDQSPLGKAVVASTAVQLQGPQGAFGTFWIRAASGSKNLIWHNGMTGGFNAFLGWVDGTKNGVFILSNTGQDVATSLGLAMLEEAK